MVLTFYQGCKLTKSYDIVYCGTYFETVEAPNLTKEIITADNIYLQNQMQFAVDMSEFTTFTKTNIFKSNYLKIVDNSNSMTRYYFIDNIDYVNGDAVVSCTIDIWTTYNTDYKMEYAHINRLGFGGGTTTTAIKTTYTTYGQTAIFAPPIRYYSNNTPTISTETSSTYYMYCFGQLYDTNTIDTATSRECVALLSKKLSSSDLKGYTEITEAIQDYTNWLLSLQNNRVSIYDPITETFGAYKYMTLVKCYIIPSTYVLEDDSTFRPVACEKYGSLDNQAFYALSDYYSNTITSTQTGDPDFKIQSLGTLTHRIDVVQNGTNHSYSVDIIRTNTDLALILSHNNVRINLEDDFEIEAPFATTEADILTQNKIARQLSLQRTDMQFTESMIKNSGSAVGGIAGAIAGIATGNMAGFGNYISNVFNAGVSLAFAPAEHELSLQQLNQQTYSSTAKLQVYQNIALSFKYGLFYLAITPDNTNQVNKETQRGGYAVDLYVNDNILTRLNGYSYAPANHGQYVIALDNIVSYGNMPNNAKQMIDTILQKGVIVYYSSN